MNVAPEATLTASSTGSTGIAPTLVDGEVDSAFNFSTARRAAPITPEAPERLVLAWPEPVSFRGLMLLVGAKDPGYGRLRMDWFDGGGMPTPASGTNH